MLSRTMSRNLDVLMVSVSKKWQKRGKESRKYKSLQLRRQTPVISPDDVGYAGHNAVRVCVCVRAFLFVAFKNPLIGCVLQGNTGGREGVGVNERDCQRKKNKERKLRSAVRSSMTHRAYIFDRKCPQSRQEETEEGVRGVWSIRGYEKRTKRRSNRGQMLCGTPSLTWHPRLNLPPWRR